MSRFIANLGRLAFLFVIGAPAGAWLFYYTLQPRDRLLLAQIPLSIWLIMGAFFLVGMILVAAWSCLPSTMRELAKSLGMKPICPYCDNLIEFEPRPQSCPHRESKLPT